MTDHKPMTTTDADGDRWVHEIHQDCVSLGYKMKGRLFTDHSEFQRVDIIETVGHGRMLLNDGIIMLSERDEFVYHEMIAHVPLFSHPAPRRVLIIGGGDGGTAREVLRHRSVSRVTMVEIDGMVIDACRRHMPKVSYPAGDPRLEVVVGDGLGYVQACDAPFDVIIVDSTDPMGPSEPLFGGPFYADTARLLGDGGILITQAESPFYDTGIQQAMLARQREHFRRLHLYLFTNLTYPGGLWSFGFASQSASPAAGGDSSRVAAAGIDFRYYTPAVHRAAFALPAFVLQRLGPLLDPDPFETA